MPQRYITSNHKILVVVIAIAISFFLNLLFADSLTIVNAQGVAKYILSIGSGILFLHKGFQSEKNQHVLLGSACIVWSFGQLLWHVYLKVKGMVIPFPSATDISFIGCYFLIISSMKCKKNNIVGNMPLAMALLLVFFVSAGFFFFSSAIVPFVRIYMIVYLAILLYVLYIALICKGINQYILSGISLLVIADFLFLFQITMDMPYLIILSDPLYLGTFIAFLMSMIGVSEHD